MRARLAGHSINEYPGTVPPDLATAYGIQDLAIDQWPDALRGWKVARIGPAWQEKYPEERLIGPVWARNVHIVAPGQEAVCPIIEGGFAAIEAEVGIHVGGDAAVGRTDWTAESAASLVGRMCIGVEMASSPLATLNDLGPGAVISDFGNNWGVIAGSPISDWKTNAHELAVETFIDDQSVGKGTIAVPGTPLSAFAFALNKAASRGRALRKGDYISCGMITGVHDIRIGQRSRIDFGRYGEIFCRAVRAETYKSQQGSSP